MKALDEMCAIENPTCEEWANFKACMCGAAAGVELEKNHKVIEAMKKSEEEEKAMDAAMKVMDGNMGYNNRRYNSGRYAPAGKGHIGYYPPEMEDDEWIREKMHNPDFEKNARMGYTHGTRVDTGSGMHSGPMNCNMGMSRFGENYDGYKESKRYYTENQDPVHKRKMNDHIAGIFDDVEYMMTDAWKDIDPQEKPKYKQRIQQIAQKMQQLQ